MMLIFEKLQTPVGVNTGKLRFEVDGVQTGQVIEIPNTGSWRNWVTASTDLGQLSRGAHVVRLAVTGPQFDVNWLDIKTSQVTSGDQCDLTSQCRAIYGDRATDCANSRSDQSICMCGSSPCSETPPAPTPEPPGVW